MKKILVLLTVFYLPYLHAQSQEAKRANLYFERTFYSMAIPLYEQAAAEKQTLDIVKNLADSYYFINDTENAKKWYQILFSSYNDLDEEHYFRYVQTLKATGDYNAANRIMRNQISKLKDEKLLSDFDNGLHELENISAIGERFDIKNLRFNTKHSEFGAVKYGDKIVFTGIKSQKGLFDKIYKWNDELYLDLMEIQLQNIQPADSLALGFSAEINTVMHEGNAVFTKDGKTVYFTRNNFKNGKRAKNAEKISNLQLYKAELADGKWGNIQSLPFNNEAYSTAHPALSTDEKTLYFASDMPGTLGGFDIYEVSIQEGIFGTPKNLGDKVNTARREQFPFFAKDNKLYFSSNGHLGYGSLDVFVSELKNGEFTRALNVGIPVNSGFDDFAFNIDPETKEGYFSSNRTGGKGNDDIYSLKETKPLVIEDCMQFIEGVVVDLDTQLPIPDALVVLADTAKTELQRITSDAEGKFRFTVACESRFVVLASKPNYTDDSKSVSSGKTRKKTNAVSLALRSQDMINKEAELAKKEAELAEAQKKKEAQLAAVEKEKKRVADIMAKEKDIVKDKDRLVIKTDPIYFDYDLWYIRKESKVILNRVVELMKKYPKMVVEIGSHTDARGNDRYNRDLSSKRAASTRQYIIEQGVPAKRISSKGYGESVPILKCVPVESCTEEQHELNRRSEFVIKDL